MRRTKTNENEHLGTNGSITALIKLHAALRGVFIAVWDRGKLVNYVTNNVEERYRKVFHDLLKTGRELHIHPYEGHLAPGTFTLFWSEAVELLDKAREAVYALLRRS